mmetsp:Transcript_30276/g.93696  ORF Transcript_30276/g.93696 Transcript_30276/m.93696 type:complete len:670 (+) Transcript_30276:129-2138(+)
MGPIFDFALCALVSGVIHELVHVVVAWMLGRATWTNFLSAMAKRAVTIDGASDAEARIIRHAGWIASVGLAVLCAAAGLSLPRRLATALVAFEACATDLVLDSSPRVFRCGNVGMIFLDRVWSDDAAYAKRATAILKKMVEVTMMRGAQSGGFVTYRDDGARGLRGVRSRVVNAKRTDLSELMVAKLRRNERAARLLHGLAPGPRFYAGHTRFATTSKATLDGTHPHQWSPAAVLDVYPGFREGKIGERVPRTVETFVTHNGDFDFFELGGRARDLGHVQNLLELVTSERRPTTVDSCAVAGVCELIRCQGCWPHALRYGFVFGPPRPWGLPDNAPKPWVYERAGAVCAGVFEAHRAAADGDLATLASPAGRASLVTGIAAALLGTEDGKALDDHDGRGLGAVARAAVDGFFDNDLLRTAVIFLEGAKGSFGLCLTNSLDAHRQLVVAARGQTVSVAAYPAEGMILFTSEQAAAKAAVGALDGLPARNAGPRDPEKGEALRGVGPARFGFRRPRRRDFPRRLRPRGHDAVDGLRRGALRDDAHLRRQGDADGLSRIAEAFRRVGAADDSVRRQSIRPAAPAVRARRSGAGPLGPTGGLRGHSRRLEGRRYEPAHGAAPVADAAAPPRAASRGPPPGELRGLSGHGLRGVALGGRAIRRGPPDVLPAPRR